MKTIELTDEELETFKEIFYEQDLQDYLQTTTNSEGLWRVVPDTHSSLFKKLGIDIGKELNE